MQPPRWLPDRVRILYHHRLGSKDGQYVHVEEIVSALRGLDQQVQVVGPAMLDQADFGGGSGLIATLKRRLPGAAYECLELGYGLHASRRLLQVARTFKPDVIYERYNLYLPAGSVVARLMGVPLLLEVNAPLAQERAEFGGLALPVLASWSESRTWQAADAILPVSRQLADLVVAAGAPAGRVHVIANGVDLERFVAIANSSARRSTLGLAGQRVVGFTGFMREWHGLDRVVEWLGTRAPADVTVCFVGDGPARESLETRASKLGVRHRLMVTGVVGRAEIPGWLDLFDIAILPAVVGYASPLKLLEYMAAGCAIVAPDRPNIRELLTDGVDALLIEPERLADTLDRLLLDTDLRRRLGRCAQAAIGERNLTWTGNAQRILDLATGLKVRP